MNDELDEQPIGEGPETALGSELPQAQEPQGDDQTPPGMLNMDTADLRDLFKALYNTFLRMISDIQGWLTNAEGAFNNHNVRLHVLEALLTAPELQEHRAKLFGDIIGPDGQKIPLTKDDLKQIVEHHVNPMLTAIAEKRAEQIRKAQEGMKRAMEAQQSGLVGPDGKPISASSAPSIVTADGRKIVFEEE